MYSKRPEYTGKCQSCFALNYTSQIYVVVAVFAEVIFLVLYYPMYFFSVLDYEENFGKWYRCS